MTQIKITPEELEQVAKTVRNSRNYLDQLHQDLYTQTEYIASMWSGATCEHFYQNFNEAKPKMFTVLMEFDKIAEELERIAEKFRKADEEEQKELEERINNKMWTDIAGELSGGYDAARAIDGIDPSTGEKVGWFDRSVAGVMVVGSLLQVGNIGKIGKIAKAADKANEAKNLLRSDDFLRSTKNAKGINKSYIDESGNLVPASKEGIHKGRQVTVTEHILGGYRKGGKNNSPFTSFSPNSNATVKYGDNSIELDFNGLRTAIRNGDVKDVAILNPKQIERLIEQDKITTPYWKNRALKWTKRDNEYLIKGEIPKDYFKIHE